MRYLAVEPAGGVVHRAVGRRGGVRRGSRISHVEEDIEADAAAAAAAAASTASTATSATSTTSSSDNIVIAPVHPSNAKKTFPVLLYSPPDPPGRFSHGPLPRALPPIIRDPWSISSLGRPYLYVEPRGIDRSILLRRQLRRDRIVTRYIDIYPHAYISTW
ncbi:hypothetical protein ALC56_14497 [Trachymyrmex septentrionalis]|uniref:Uncharacterized protein n=1 Tax=Trachymyrmex septentrionalis TaxID=34720 RepID=A0A195ETM4_9HYME|nr:hypothetical protein ALC56_14497 [Trachymyrmex septentrionalis]